MRRSIVLLVVAITAVGAGWRLAGRATTEHAAAPHEAAPAVACRWNAGQRFAFDVAIDSELTFDETALTPAARGLKTAGRTEKAGAAGRLDAEVVSVAPNGSAILATRLSSWSSDAAGADAFPAIDADVRRPYLMQVDARCHVVASARAKTASVIAYRRVLAVVDRMDFALPEPGADPATPYANRQIDDFGWYALENRFAGGHGRGAIERKRLSYDPQPAAGDALPVEIRIKSAGGSVTLGDDVWFAELKDHEDLEVVSSGRVPLRSVSTSAFTATKPNAHAFVDAPVALADFVWGRPTDAELQAAHDALRGSELAGLSALEAVERFLAVRDGGAPGAWHDSQRLLRDWMRGNPEGVRQLGRDMAAGQHTRKDQADFTLAMARSGSNAARRELEGLAGDDAVTQDLRVQAASACGDAKNPTTETVDALERIASAPRNGTSDDILPSTATMALGSIVDNAPGTPAAVKARGVLHRTLATGDRRKTIEALYAASNTADPSFTGAAVAAARSDDADERAAAAHTLRKMPPSKATADTFDTLLQADTNPEVVKQIAESRREQLQTYGGQLSQKELSLYATKLPSAPEGVRWEILRTLGTASRMQPTAQQVLVDWYRDEPVVALKMVIGQYVPASSLR